MTKKLFVQAITKYLLGIFTALQEGVLMKKVLDTYSSKNDININVLDFTNEYLFKPLHIHIRTRARVVG